MIHPRRRLRVAAALLAAALAAACGDSVHIPPPAGTSATRAIPEAEPSTVTLPVTVSLAQVAAQVESSVPRGQNREDEWRPLGKFPVVGTLYVKEMWERDPLDLRIHGDHVDVDAHVRYRARIAARPCAPLVGCRWVPLAGCGQNGAMPTVDVGLRTALVWSREWTLTARTKPQPVRAGVPCRLTEAKIDVTDRVRTLVQGLLDRAAPQVDAKIKEAAQLRRRVDGVWTAAQKPIGVSKGVWLLLQPQGLAAALPRGEGTTIGTDVSLTLRPRVVVSPDTPKVERRPLPPSGTVAGARGFRVALIAELPFAAANEVLERKLAGREFDVKGKKVRVRQARLYGGGDRIVLAVSVTGDAKGMLYFVGTPAFDPRTQVISVPDLDFSVESRQVLPRVAGWLLYDDLREQMRAAAHFDLSEKIAGIHRDVDRALTRELAPGVRLAGGLETLTPLGVYVFPNALAAVVEASGHGQIRVDVRTRRRPGPDSSSRNRR